MLVREILMEWVVRLQLEVIRAMGKSPVVAVVPVSLLVLARAVLQRMLRQVRAQSTDHQMISL